MCLVAPARLSTRQSVYGDGPGRRGGLWWTGRMSCIFHGIGDVARNPHWGRLHPICGAIPDLANRVVARLAHPTAVQTPVLFDGQALQEGELVPPIFDVSRSAIEPNGVVDFLAGLGQARFSQSIPC